MLISLTLLGILLLAVLVHGYATPGAQLFGRVYSKGPSGGMTVALTFDDGPNDPHTSRVLDILRTSGNLKATFFTTGKNVQDFPETAKRILNEGHVLGNHSFSHNANHAVIPGGYRDIGRAQTAIFETLGVLPHLYRPPHGKKSPWEHRYLKDHGLVAINWSAATGELGKKSPEVVARRLLGKVRPGAIILLHDGYGNEHGNRHADKSLTVHVLPMVIRALQAQGYKFATVPELLGIPAYGTGIPKQG